MSLFDTNFVMELFLDDNVSNMNRAVVAAANVFYENYENISYIENIFRKECRSRKNVSLISKNVVFEKRNIRNKKQTYEDFTIKYSDTFYVTKFKMHKKTMQSLLNYLKDFYTNASLSIIPLSIKVHIFIYHLTTDTSLSEVSEYFGISKSSVSYIFHEIATLLSEQRFNFINWPSLEEQHITRVKVNSRCGFPNCVGFIDSSRLKVGSKQNQGNSKIVLLQAVCDENLMFFDIHIGEIGNTHKNKVFKDSQLGHELKNFIEFDNHILGSTEYKLRKNLITPFIPDEPLTNDELRFNEIHRKASTHIGQAFDLLRQRFKKLNNITLNKPEAVKKLITAACVLHNFILLHEGSTNLKEESVNIDEGLTIDRNLVQTAVEKRLFLCNYINFMEESI
ncbi:unnamed protein product [Leptidea sinapis]|uniref:DDE Tnp4 domain-containing protein n=1 Tax=Leptidea sinapis TaxID=189913 RepID=A0A5E4Q3W4_9NEOP|nr:unnamed protein product [Leptidea sinapis]